MVPPPEPVVHWPDDLEIKDDEIYIRLCWITIQILHAQVKRWFLQWEILLKIRSNRKLSQ